VTGRDRKKERFFPARRGADLPLPSGAAYTQGEESPGGEVGKVGVSRAVERCRQKEEREAEN